MSKLIVLGAPLTGKTTLTKKLRETVTIPVLDFDEELMKLNNGKYPANYPTLNEQLRSEIIKTISVMNEVIFFAFEIDLDAIQNMKLNGFNIVQLTAPYDVLEKRNKERLKNDPDNDAFQYVLKNIEYQKTVSGARLVDKTIDTSEETPSDTLRSITELL